MFLRTRQGLLQINAVPTKYEVTVEPDLDTFTFLGILVAEINIKKNCNKIMMNSSDIVLLNQQNICYATQNDDRINIIDINFNRQKETVTLTFERQLKAGQAQLRLHYSGIISEDKQSFFRSSYVGPDSLERYIFLSRFEPADARRTFPCWDDPFHKATFDITIVTPVSNRLSVLSNQNEKSRSITRDDKMAVSFHQTPVMSPYLVAFLAGEFEFIETKTIERKSVRVFTPVGKLLYGNFALEACAKFIDYYQTYFGIDYPLNKMDMVTLPDYPSKAGTTWGLIVYRDIRIFVDPFHTTSLKKQKVALRVAREMSNQWMNNLATIKWWADIWFKESLSTFIQYLAVTSAFPNFEVWDQFLIYVYNVTLESDSLEHINPIEMTNIRSPAQLIDVLDDYTHLKGATILRMLYELIGENNFRQGISCYLSKFSYKNICPEDLWSSMDNFTDLPIQKIMSSWTRQRGYPIVRIEDVHRNGKRLELKLSQERFTLTGRLTAKDYRSIWCIPLFIVSRSSPDKLIYKQVMMEKYMNIQFELPEGDWFKFRQSPFALYRIRYTFEQLKSLKEAIRKRQMPVNDRVDLLNDMYAMVLAGKQSSVELFKLIEAYHQERSYIVMCAICDIFRKFDYLLIDEKELQQKFRIVCCKMLNKILRELGWNVKSGESHLNTLLRLLVIEHLIALEDKPVIDICRKLFADHLSRQKLIPVDLRDSVFRAVSAVGNEETFEQLLGLFHLVEFQEEKNRLVGSLGWTRDENLLLRVFDLSISDEISPQDFMVVIYSAANNIPLGRDMAWEFFQRNREVFTARHSPQFLAKVIKLFTRTFIKHSQADGVKEFFDMTSFAGSERVLKHILETIYLNVNLLSRDLEGIRIYFNNLS